MEERRLMTASLGSLTDLSVPAQLGYQVTLDGSGTTSPSQTFQVSSSNPNIKVSVAQGPYWTLTVSHQPANSNDVTINQEKMTYQLFQDLTPNTVDRITNLTNQGFYTTGITPSGQPGKYFPRITSTGDAGFAVAQGGSTSATSTASSSGITPIATEPVQQLAFTGQYQIAMANTGAPNSTDAQFFITSSTLSTSVQQAFDFNYTIFGQLVSGQSTVQKLSQVAVQENSSGEDSQPITPVTIDAAEFSSTNPSGVLHIDTTSARQGDVATITVTATDPSDNTTVTRTFNVTISAYNGPTSPIINFVPFASAVSAVTAGTPVRVQLAGASGYPNTSANAKLSYELTSQPANGTVSQFDSSTGTFVYTPNAGFLGTDTFQYRVLSQGPNSVPATAFSQPADVTVTVGTGITNAVRVIDDVLVVTPQTRYDRRANQISITQGADSTTGTEKLLVTVNGILDAIQPSVDDITQIVVFGGKASSRITIDPSVTTPAVLNGGTAGRHRIQAGGGTTLLHGWFGQSILIGGTGENRMIGRKGVVRFRPSSATLSTYAGNANPRLSLAKPTPAGGTYRFLARAARQTS